MSITPQFLFDLESRMRLVSAESFGSLNAATWWRSVAKEMPSMSARERFCWLLDSAKIEYVQEGNVEFEEMVMLTTEFEARNAAKGLKLTRNQFEDLDGNGVKLAANWSRQIGALAAYWPQKQVAAAILANGTAYDAKAFFASDHPLNPFDTAAGSYANLHKTSGGASGAGACPIDVSVTLEEAYENLAALFAYIRNIKQPNGEDPRLLRAVQLIVPTALLPRASQLTAASMIAMDSKGGGGGSADGVKAMLSTMGFKPPVEAPELGASFSGGSDTDFYVAVEEIGADDLGALTYVNREPFAVTYYSGSSGGNGLDAILSRSRELEWHVQGRNVVGYGHPYLLHKCKSS
jgi:hypothetical protein